ncbi:sigma-E factor negative regulatory protein [Marinomonas sp. C2222]|uniref:Sigma-E factor negative regulatory protein n=1 Tax=Marinomonas sargassi TaxID=2984494 RepID=A0ABT2YVJ0_9GAMM|nr:sigma-E factor negative regulatory protein [Marinomonas sargassi]MCV2403922.1 sigma-E factor negative regulatory protein [Marinomonas sargassi]
MTTHNTPKELSSSLSAMFDGEATDKDIELLLSADSLKLHEQLENYQLVRSALQGETPSTLVSDASFFNRVTQAIDAEQAAKQENIETDNVNVVPISAVKQSGNNSKDMSLKTIFSSLAIAASVSFVVIFGGNTLFSPVEEGIGITNVVGADSVDSLEEPISLAELELQDAMPADNIRLQHYLRQHAEQSTMNVGQGMMPMARVVSYPIEE